VAIVPLLDFSHPISLVDHEEATEILRTVCKHYGRTVAVFGQNRSSNHILAMRLHVRGYTSLLDSDLSADWSAALDNAPDFLFISLGGNLSEAVNPPPDLFSCGVVLAPGFRPPDIFDYLQRVALRESDEPDTHVPESVSRVAQAAGRLQRSPQTLKPVLLVNKSFARPEFLKAFPRDWYSRHPEELLFDNLNDAQAFLNGTRHAK
jgi:Rad3-related DNA helicase